MTPPPEAPESAVEERSLADEKRILRAKYRALRQSLSAEARRASDAALLSALLQSPLYRLSTLFLYISVGSEPDTRALLEHALRDKKRVAAPRCGADGLMTFYEVRSLDALVPDRYGIPAPPPDAAPVLPDRGTLCLVPGLAFDRAGHRLGQGGGYYDRFLPGFPGTTVGCCRSVCLADALVSGPLDCPVDQIVTESGVICVSFQPQTRSSPESEEPL